MTTYYLALHLHRPQMLFAVHDGRYVVEFGQTLDWSLLQSRLQQDGWTVTVAPKTMVQVLQ